MCREVAEAQYLGRTQEKTGVLCCFVRGDVCFEFSWAVGKLKQDEEVLCESATGTGLSICGFPQHGPTTSSAN